MNFGQAIASGFSNYATFSGRACRSEYWYWFLFVIIGHIVAAIIDRPLGVRVVAAVFTVIVLLPGIAMGVRRLHDLDRTGWWLLLGLIPIIGTIVLLIWFCTKGTEGANRFGSDPLAGLAQVSPRPIA